MRTTAKMVVVSHHGGYIGIAPIFGSILGIKQIPNMVISQRAFSIQWELTERVACSFSFQVDYATFDISAHRDVKYIGAKGTIRFEKGPLFEADCQSVLQMWILNFRCVVSVWRLVLTHLDSSWLTWLWQGRCSSFWRSNWLKTSPSRRQNLVQWSCLPSPTSAGNAGVWRQAGLVTCYDCVTFGRARDRFSQKWLVVWNMFWCSLFFLTLGIRIPTDSYFS